MRPENSNTDRSMCVIPREENRLSPFLQFCCPPLEKEGQRTKPKWTVFLVFILWQQQLWSSEGHKRNTLLRHWAKRSKWSPCFASEKKHATLGRKLQIHICATGNVCYMETPTLTPSAQVGFPPTGGFLECPDFSFEAFSIDSKFPILKYILNSYVCM